MNRPSTAAVTATPRVASTAAGQKASRTIAIGVFSPPSNKMTASAMLPIK